MMRVVIIVVPFAGEEVLVVSVMMRGVSMDSVVMMLFSCMVR